MSRNDGLDGFLPAVSTWFRATFGETPVAGVWGGGFDMGWSAGR